MLESISHINALPPALGEESECARPPHAFDYNDGKVDRALGWVRHAVVRLVSADSDDPGRQLPLHLLVQRNRLQPRLVRIRRLLLLLQHLWVNVLAIWDFGIHVGDAACFEKGRLVVHPELWSRHLGSAGDRHWTFFRHEICDLAIIVFLHDEQALRNYSSAVRNASNLRSKEVLLSSEEEGIGDDDPLQVASELHFVLPGCLQLLGKYVWQLGPVL
mmetsp:Transcript_7261/g.5532  ORF Transcript_7261/g.5532 Transcript_7261/m.5532 type:complete len:217 (+) Transcript_7261:174-824(+)